MIKASELLLQSAEPFDKACVMVREMEEELIQLRGFVAIECDTFGAWWEALERNEFVGVSRLDAKRIWIAARSINGGVKL